jgi:hypothetical protein
MKHWSPRSLVVGIVSCSVLCGGVAGFASGNAWSSKTLSGNLTSVARCDADGISVTQNLVTTNVVSVTLGGIASACGGGTASATVNNGLTSSGGSAAVPAGGGSVVVTLSVSVLAKDAEEIDATISGP